MIITHFNNKLENTQDSANLRHTTRLVHHDIVILYPVVRANGFICETRVRIQIPPTKKSIFTVPRWILLKIVKLRLQLSCLMPLTKTNKQTETEHNLYSTEVNNVESTVCVDGGAPSVRVTLTRVSAHAM